MADIARPDLCIVGAGMLGTALAHHAKRLDADVVLVDREWAEETRGPGDAVALSGLRHVAATIHAFREASRLGLGVSEPKVRLKSIQEMLEKLSSEWAPQVDHARLVAAGIGVQPGPVRFLDHATLQSGETRLKPRQIILAPSAMADVPPVPGLDQVDFFTVDTLLRNTRKLTHLLVIGGDSEAVALAQIYRRLGSDVTLVPQGDVLPGLDRETVAILLSVLAEDGVRVLDGGVVSEIQPRSQGIGAVVDMPSGTTENLDLSHILVCGPRRAELTGLDLEKARLRLSKSAISSLEMGPLGRTSNRLVRVVGIAAGIEQWHEALAHGRAVVDSVLLGSAKAPESAATRLVLTEPGLAQFGMLPASGSAMRADAHLLRFNMAENAEALALRRSTGLVKVLVDRRGMVLAASAVGAGATDIVSILVMAREQGIALDRLAHLAVPFPSLLAVVTQLGQDFAGQRPASPWIGRRRAIRRLWPS